MRLRRSHQVIIYLQLLCIESYIKNKNKVFCEKQRKPDYLFKYTSTAIGYIKYSLINKYYQSRVFYQKSCYEAEFQFKTLSKNKIESIALKSEYFFEFIQLALDYGYIIREVTNENDDLPF